jgi:hypothetical protein
MPTRNPLTEEQVKSHRRPRLRTGVVKPADGEKRGRGRKQDEIKKRMRKQEQRWADKASPVTTRWKEQP